MAVKRPAGPPPTTTACVDLSFVLFDSDPVLVVSVIASLDMERDMLGDDDAVNDAAVSADLL